MSKKITLFLLIGVFFICFTSVAYAEMTLAEKYPGPWKTDYNHGIAKALAKNKIRGCGEFKYKEHVSSSREYVVRCTRDGVNWCSYLVWVGIDHVMGPYPPDPSLD